MTVTFQQIESKVELPDRLSDLIDVALDDLETVENKPDFVVDMGYWATKIRREGRENPPCHVCLAGATIAARFEYDELPEHITAAMESGPTPLTRKMRALDKIARADSVGDIVAAVRFMYGFQPGITEKLEQIEAPAPCSYAIQGAAWKNTRRRIAADLRKLGL